MLRAFADNIALSACGAQLPPFPLRLFFARGTMCAVSRANYYSSPQSETNSIGAPNPLLYYSDVDPAHVVPTTKGPAMFAKRRDNESQNRRRCTRKARIFVGVVIVCIVLGAVGAGVSLFMINSNEDTLAAPISDRNASVSGNGDGTALPKGNGPVPVDILQTIAVEQPLTTAAVPGLCSSPKGDYM